MPELWDQHELAVIMMPAFSSLTTDGKVGIITMLSFHWYIHFSCPKCSLPIDTGIVVYRYPEFSNHQAYLGRPSHTVPVILSTGRRKPWQIILLPWVENILVFQTGAALYSEYQTVSMMPILWSLSYGIIELWFRWWLITCSVKSPFMHQRWLIVNGSSYPFQIRVMDLKNNVQWNLNHNSICFLQENIFENVMCGFVKCMI